MGKWAYPSNTFTSKRFQSKTQSKKDVDVERQLRDRETERQKDGEMERQRNREMET